MHSSHFLIFILFFVFSLARSESATARNVMIWLEDHVKLSQLDIDPRMKRSEKREHVRAYLIDHSTRSQACVVDILSARGVKFSTFWISPAIHVPDLSLPVQRELQHTCDPSSYTIRRTGQIKRMNAVARTPPRKRPPAPNSVQWNIALINADQVWAKGVNGSDISVASIDGGVNYKHDALVYNYRGTSVGSDGKLSFDHDYNWVDYAYGDSVPSDSDGHGTNVMGIAVASQDSGVGVAVGSRWLTAKVFNYAGYAEEDWLLSSAQWVMCPTPVGDTDATQGDCSKGADVVSCSWGEDFALSLAWKVRLYYLYLSFFSFLFFCFAFALLCFPFLAPLLLLTIPYSCFFSLFSTLLSSFLRPSPPLPSLD
jgi:hypothetical protein